MSDVTEVILFPDVEAIAVSYLKDSLADTPISTRVPDPRPARFIRVMAVGGSKARLNADSVMLTFQCWEATTVKASELARLARAYVHALAGTDVAGNWVYRVIDVGGPAFAPDPSTNTPRYQFTVSIDVKGESL